MTANAKPEVRAFFDHATNTVSYLVFDAETKHGAIVDPVLDYDMATGKAATRSADTLLNAAAEAGVIIDWVLETHAHADHLSGAPYVKLKTGATVGIGEHIRDVQKIFRPVFNATDVSGDGSEFDHLFAEGERFRIGNLDASVLHTPGHTPACVSYVVGDTVFVGDTLFMPDYGTARADFPGGDARTLYRSIQKLLALPDQTRIFVCHDYLPDGRRDYAWETTIGEERKNVQLDGVSEDDFVKWRQGRDANLAAPLLLLPSIQTNIRAGKLPPAEANGVSYIKIPVKLTS
jgi:glyoxylase-like metal-dependent hydrolase (beta-lactamase superfamily II)